MVEVVVTLAALTEIIEAVTIGLDFLKGLQERVEDAFSHARTRTRQLAEAAQFATNFIELFQSTVEELQVVFGTERGKHIYHAFKKLQRAVAKADKTMRELENKSTAQWLIRGG